MANRQRSNRQRSEGRGFKSYVSLFSFIAVMLLGFALALSFTLGKISSDLQGVANVIKHIGIVIALIVTLFISYYEAKKQSQIWFILWIVAVVLVVVFYILTLI